MAEPAVRLSDVRFRWSGAAPLTLDIPTFEVGAGERVTERGERLRYRAQVVVKSGGVHGGSSRSGSAGTRCVRAQSAA